MAGTLTTYLCGPIQDTTDGGMIWRETIRPKLEELGIVVLDPTVSEPNTALTGSVLNSQEKLEGLIRSGHWHEWDKIMDDIMDDDLRCVRKCDFLVVYLDAKHKMGGTVSEIHEAVFHCKIPIYAVSYDPRSELNYWVVRMIRRNGQIFESWAQLLEFVEAQHGTYARKA